jgi:acetyl-CoA C-acetyltransferase
MTKMPKKTNGRPVAILGGVRTPFCRSGTQFEEFSTVDLLKENMKALVEKFSIHGQILGDVALGTVFYHPSVWNMAREAVLASGLAPETPALGIQRACATSLDATISIANKIALGKIESGIAGGAESLSNIALHYQPVFSRRLAKTSQAKNWQQRLKAWQGVSLKELKPASPGVVEPTTGKTMGQHCEMMAKDWHVSREEQDELALRSHQNSVKGYESNFYSDLVTPIHGVNRDNIVRSDTSKEKMGKLKPVFDTSAEGTLTAGNSSPLTDGSACVLLSSEEWAKEHKFEPQAFLVDYETAAIDLEKEGLLMAPAYAVPRMLDRFGMSLQQFDFYEIHEAFAAQVLCTLKAWESETFCRERLSREVVLGSIDREKLNVFGGSVALGHPFGATGARMILTAAKLLAQKGGGKSLLSICTGGGMGTAAILER